MAMQEAKQRFYSKYIVPTRELLSSASPVECYVCGKGLPDGHSITAKALPSGIVLFCNLHYPSEN